MYVVKTSKGFLKDFVPKEERKEEDVPEPIFTKKSDHAKNFSFKASWYCRLWLIEHVRNCTPVNIVISSDLKNCII